MASLVMTGDVELQRMTQDLLGSGKIGKKIFRKGIRAGAKVVAVRVKHTFPRKSGAAASSAKVKAIKRSRGKIGVRVSVYAESKTGKKGFPYPLALEAGAKQQPPGERVRKVTKKIVVNGRPRRVTDEAASKAYHALVWHIEPQHNVKKAFDATAGQASQVIATTCEAELAKVSVK